MDIYAKFKWSGKSNKNVNSFSVFKMIEFENILENSIYMQLKIVKVLETAENKIEGRLRYIKNLQT